MYRFGHQGHWFSFLIKEFFVGLTGLLSFVHADRSYCIPLKKKPAIAVGIVYYQNAEVITVHYKSTYCVLKIFDKYCVWWFTVRVSPLSSFIHYCRPFRSGPVLRLSTSIGIVIKKGLANFICSTGLFI